MHRKVKYKNGTKFQSLISANRPFRNRARRTYFTQSLSREGGANESEGAII